MKPLTTSLSMKVLLVDDHPLILDALQTVIAGSGSQVKLVGATNANEARSILAEDRDFQLVLLDLNLGEADGFSVLGEFRSQYPTLPVVVLSASDRASDVIRCIDLGAMGFVPKRAHHGVLQEALAQVMRGQIYVPAMLLGSQPEPPMGALHTTSSSSASARPAPPRRTLESYGLTPRQTDVLALLLQGKPNKLIARDLHVSVETVKDHVAAVLRALDVSTRTQAVLVVSEMAPSSLGVLRKNAA